MELAKDTVNNSLVSIDFKGDLYSAVIQNALEGFVSLNLEGDILDVNEAFSRMTGYSRDELLSMNVYDLYPQKVTADKYAEFINDYLKQGGTNLETRHRCKDGRIIDVKVSFKYSDANGGIFFTFHSDITEEKKRKLREERNLTKTRETLKDTEDRCHTLMELGSRIGEAIIMLQDIHDREGMHTYVSDRWESFTGYSRKDLLAMSFFDLVKPEDKDASISRHRQKMSGKAIPDLIELTIIHKDGHEVPVELTSASTIYNKQPVNMMYIRDITERKRFEVELFGERDKYRGLFENVPVAISEVDFSMAKKIFDDLKKKGITDFNEYFGNKPDKIKECYATIKSSLMNPKAIEINEAENINELQQWRKRISNNIFKDENYCGCLKYWKNCEQLIIELAQGRTNWSREASIVTENGKVKTTQEYIVVAPGHEDTLSKVYIYYLDITDLKEKETKLRAYRDRLESMVKKRTNELNASLKREKDLNQKLETKVSQQIEFIRRLVHDLKTPLSPLLFASEMMVDSLEEKTLKRIAVNINRGAIQLNNSVNDLVDIVRGEIGTIQLNYKETDLVELLSEIIEYFNFEADRKGQILKLELNNNLPIIGADRDRLKQVIINLLENAMRYTPPKGSITLRARSDKKNIIVEIIDTGCGIKDEDLPFLFQSHYTTENHTSRHDGLGLGLQLSKMLVELHGGTIWAKNEPSNGAKFGFSIPVKSIDKLVLENV